jgi:hypothetical protein
LQKCISREKKDYLLHARTLSNGKEKADQAVAVVVSMFVPLAVEGNEEKKENAEKGLPTARRGRKQKDQVRS